jgi:hypothetical protein
MPYTRLESGLGWACWIVLWNSELQAPHTGRVWGAMGASEHDYKLTQVVARLVICRRKEIVGWKLVVMKVCMIGDKPTKFGDLRIAMKSVSMNVYF